MKLETYVSKDKEYYKISIIGVLKSRCEIKRGRFLGFEGPPSYGWYKIKVEGIEKSPIISEHWVRSNPPLDEGEMLEMLLDTIDNTIWKMDRVHAEENPQKEEDVLKDATTKSGDIQIPQPPVKSEVKAALE